MELQSADLTHVYHGCVNENFTPCVLREVFFVLQNKETRTIGRSQFSELTVIVTGFVLQFPLAVVSF